MLDVGGWRHEAQLRRAAGAGAEQHAAHAAALDLHRHRVVLVGDSVTSAMYGNTRVTWPTTPFSSMTACARAGRRRSMPLSTKSFCVNGSRPV